MFAFVVIMYDLSIEPSYNSLKTYIGNKWPYMNVIYDMKSKNPFVKNKPCSLFSSYSYLYNHSNTSVQEYAIKSALLHSTGNHGPRMLIGNLSIIVQLESAIASFFNKEACIVSSIGYMACCSAIQVLCDKKTIIFADSHCHASLVSGFKLSQAKIVYFKHNCANSLELLLNWYTFRKCKKVIVTESLFSMDGTLCDLPAIKKLSLKHNATLVVDEAHGLGTLGKYGKGIEDHYNMPNTVDIFVGTFSKSLSNLGGYICGSKDFIKKCEYYGHGNVFTAAISAYHAAGAYRALEEVNEENVAKLSSNTRYFRQKLIHHGFDIKGHDCSPVIPIVFKYDIFKLIDICHSMHNEGFVISPILPPACSIFEPRFRLTATTAQTHEQIDDFVNTLKLHTTRYQSKLNLETLKLLRIYRKVKIITYSQWNFILTIWTTILCIYPCFKTFFMKNMITMFNKYNLFIQHIIFKTNRTV
tara:strand:- start:4866 stop:6278 length:1413 start_codon:yes stop_codon:yes gene_type:complete